MTQVQEDVDFAFVESADVSYQDSYIWSPVHVRIVAFEPNPNCPYPVTCKLSKNCQKLCSQ